MTQDLFQRILAEAIQYYRFWDIAVTALCLVFALFRSTVPIIGLGAFTVVIGIFIDRSALGHVSMLSVLENILVMQFLNIGLALLAISTNGLYRLGSLGGMMFVLLVKLDPTMVEHL